MKTRYYIGGKIGAPGEVFKAATVPDAIEYGARYGYCIGPFRTKRGALYMLANWHRVATVQQAEAAQK